MRLYKVLLVCLLSIFVMTGFAETNSDVTKHQAKHSQKATTTKVNINTADAKSLSTLKRIGAKKAQAIIEYRKQHGKFKSIQDLAKVKGISARIVESNKERLVI
jgi:competence protein ComEA